MITSIDAQKLSDLLASTSVFLVDVRERAEYQREHIAEAQLFPTSSMTPSRVLAAAQNKTEICVYCASGGRSLHACRAIAESLAKSDSGSHITLYNLTGGMSAWRLAKLPVVEDKGAPLPIIRQVHLIASSLILTGSILGRFYNPNFFFLPLFVGCGLFLSGATGFCGMALILQKIPYNR